MKDNNNLNIIFSSLLHDLRSMLSVPFGLVEDLREGYEISNDEVLAACQRKNDILAYLEFFSILSHQEKKEACSIKELSEELQSQISEIEVSYFEEGDLEVDLQLIKKVLFLIVEIFKLIEIQELPLKVDIVRRDRMPIFYMKNISRKILNESKEEVFILKLLEAYLVKIPHRKANLLLSILKEQANIPILEII